MTSALHRRLSSRRWYSAAEWVSTSESYSWFTVSVSSRHHSSFTATRWQSLYCGCSRGLSGTITVFAWHLKLIYSRPQTSEHFSLVREVHQSAQWRTLWWFSGLISGFNHMQTSCRHQPAAGGAVVMVSLFYIVLFLLPRFFWPWLNSTFHYFGFLFIAACFFLEQNP